MFFLDIIFSVFPSVWCVLTVFLDGTIDRTGWGFFLKIQQYGHSKSPQQKDILELFPHCSFEISQTRSLQTATLS